MADESTTNPQRQVTSAQDLLGLVAAAGGGLGAVDLSELTGLEVRQVEEHLRQQSAFDPPDEGRLDGYRQRLHAWAARYRELGWPAGTPEYLLRGYYRMLQATGNLAEMVACAMDRARHDRMLDLPGGDVAAIAEVTAAQE